MKFSSEFPLDGKLTAQDLLYPHKSWFLIKLQYLDFKPFWISQNNYEEY